MSNEILHTRIQNRFKDIFENPPEVPQYIIDNLSRELRPYQKQALRQFIYTQRSDTADIAFNHLLFHMATGSGKTLVLAGTILYLFKEKGFQNFIFFVNSDAIIKKTYDNLTNSASSKYLFKKDGIVIDGDYITIQVVDVFPAIPADNTIYLKLTTIQKLHMDLTNPIENGVTYESLKNTKIVLLADEAHHINVLTRSDKKKLTKKEEQERTWEHTVNKLLSINPANRLLEFTATIDLTNDALFNKYCDKIVYQYDLKQFMLEGYSKNIVLLRANEDDRQKMMHAMLLSQYKKYIARENGINLKPVILFKSNKIAISKQANEVFLNMVKNLTVEQLHRVIQQGLTIYQNKESIWSRMFEFYSRKDLTSVIRDLQWDFNEQTTLNANDSSLLSENNAILLNSLEDSDNPIRTIFAVAKLNEGWDVLNLFDIVRISEGSSNTRTTTDSEAQLIGRGARYYPFEYKGEKSFTRRFDESPNDLKVIETLHYHTINENAYIQNLYKSLESADIQVKEDDYIRIEAKIKSDIRKAEWFRNGKIYINKVVPTTPDDYKCLEDYNISTSYEIDYEKSIEQLYGSKREIKSSTARHVQELKPNKRIWQKAIQRNRFYRFDNLKNYIPGITSMREFIEKPNFLGGVTIKVSLPYSLSIDNLSPNEHLKIAEQFLSYAEKNIRSNYMKEKGTPIFEGISMSEQIQDYVLVFNKITNRVNNIEEVKNVKDMRKHPWYIYDKAIVNRLEEDFIDFINNYVEELKKKYNEAGVLIIQ
ncbi:DEAD/DEAH box helicase family protein [Geobacillus thermodenitrificans]|uniref:DEAD/DEAH box helicase family protein n=1 Tax=Geobacillus thermodenitrificans TaxID=33940 RepID=A0ABY9Q7Q9_GEOTD|nr:DEAD/DEAH box helicase family protein [Geobacillus thermodenitrificans]WMV74960.1 DEAD/DEAH box helicase family protein [Geobacillus thermodenitrificans]